MTTQEFISIHADDDVRRLALQAARFADVDMPYALDQIAGRQTARRKLPSWAAIDGMVYPPRISMEQCSSEPAARYKAALVARLLDAAGVARSGATLADLTGGFGVDFSFLAPLFGRACYVERDERLCRVASHNFGKLSLTHATVTCARAEDELERMPRHTVVFLDPARRDTHGFKTVAIADCTPDVTALLPLLLSKAQTVVVKLSPMLDWHKALADLEGSVAEVHIVALQGECKELLLVLSAALHGNRSHPVRMVCADMVRDGGTASAAQAAPSLRTVTFEYTLPTGLPDEPLPHIAPADMLADTAQPLFLHDPNAAVMKAGCFGRLAERFGLAAVSHNSHLFLSRCKADGFPGRIFTVESASPMNRKSLRAMLAGTEKANIAVRNFPLSAEALRKRLKLGDGGDTYIFAVTSATGEHLLLKCSKA